MKKNIFNKIGTIIKEDKQKRKSEIDKYWNLPPIERMDYDNKVKNYLSKRIPLCYLTIALCKLIFYGMLFFCIFNYFFGSNETLVNASMIVSQRAIILYAISYISAFFMLDLCLYFISKIHIKNCISNLKKRFKL